MTVAGGRAPEVLGYPLSHSAGVGGAPLESLLLTHSEPLRGQKAALNSTLAVWGVQTGALLMANCRLHV